MVARVVLASLIGLATSLALPEADPPADRKLTPDQARERFHGVWLEEARVRAGARTTDPSDLFGWEFGDRGWWVWLRRGELSAAGSDRGVRIDATAVPMRFDLLDRTDTGRFVRPGVFKFDGDKLVIVVADHWVRERGLAGGEDFPTRPKGFESKRGDGAEVLVLRRGRFFYDQD